MKQLLFVLSSITLFACGTTTGKEAATANATRIAGTWKLLKGEVIAKGDTNVTDYTKDVSFIKIINDTHFAFLQHDLKNGKDSAAAAFSAGGGRYSLQDSSYTEHLEYCNAREWEGHDFTFTITFKGDTLIQRGVEQVEGAGINQVNTETYLRVKD